MTYTEIIDNIQTRIENLISERLAGTYQHITIEPSDYNPDIDDEITVTITVTDQNNDPISDWTVPLLINGSAITGTLTTNNQGVATYTHTCNEWGVCRFSVKSYSTNINITGYKKVQSLSNHVEVYCNGENVLIDIQGAITLGANRDTLLATLSSTYAPKNMVSAKYHYSIYDVGLGVLPNGQIVANSGRSTNQSLTARVHITYPMKSKII